MPNESPINMPASPQEIDDLRQIVADHLMVNVKAIKYVGEGICSHQGIQGKVTQYVFFKKTQRVLEVMKPKKLFTQKQIDAIQKKFTKAELGGLRFLVRSANAASNAVPDDEEDVLRPDPDAPAQTKQQFINITKAQLKAKMELTNDEFQALMDSLK